MKIESSHDWGELPKCRCYLPGELSVRLHDFCLGCTACDPEIWVKDGKELKEGETPIRVLTCSNYKFCEARKRDGIIK